ncbi:hypothetical protein N7468_006417 [Penicillium chermesinum]|uniref:Zn(2)-C6 fungal-type domain-containing protein n=1 Tax=Penicillium chermesinum TaxID=63820 RepID=A0A9W9NS68_9EURO|nr:uncharacterized protein N7468_006417 [Penicillium chermesinum]KAJ5225192.1 hypothetical protein N7468_006417 [Penicillium chermesinum]KAJ6140506.1 hypothetical protein N7470_010302 [Penicillium chermesinum]
MPVDQDSSPPLRVSQRRPLACRECTKRKRKCDKQVPCSRCRRLNLHCSVEVVQLRRNTVQHASEIQFLASILSELDSFSAEKVPRVARRLRDRISQLQTGHSNDSEEAASVSAADDQETPSTTQEDKGLRHRFVEIPPEGNDPPLLTAIEHLAWGRNSAGCFPHRRCGCEYRRDTPELLSMNSGSFQIYGSSLETLVMLPPTEFAQKLVKFHVTHLTWHHNAFHTPTFLEQCQLFWETGRCDHPLWMALYFAVLSCTVNSIQNSVKLRLLVNIDLDAMQSVHQLFSAMVQTLYSCHFLNNLSIYSVQAVVISTEVAHNLGLSQLNATLFNAAVRIAECLGIHKIKDHSKKFSQNRDEWEERIEREVGRRVWCQMLIQDHFAIPFTDTYSISPMHFSTGLPLNADDHDLVDIPSQTPTISSYVRTLVSLAALMPGLVDGLGPMNRRKPTQEQYEHILKVDQRMRTIVKNIPLFMLRPDTAKEAEIPWLTIARRSLAITAAEKIIMIHRLFLFRSFHDSNYGHSRRTCVAAAMTILREHETIVEEGDLSIWTHTAFAITAGVILCFEMNALIQDPAKDKANVEMYRIAVIAARNRLAARTGDLLAQRGVALIDSILIAEQSSSDGARTNNQTSIDFNRIISNFSTLSRASVIPYSDEMTPSKMSANTPDGMNSVDMNEVQFPWNQEEIDFDRWFNGIFNSFAEA